MIDKSTASAEHRSAPLGERDAMVQPGPLETTARHLRG
jgi:hypothetical protein